WLSAATDCHSSASDSSRSSALSSRTSSAIVSTSPASARRRSGLSAGDMSIPFYGRRRSEGPARGWWLVGRWSGRWWVVGLGLGSSLGWLRRSLGWPPGGIRGRGPEPVVQLAGAGTAPARTDRGEIDCLRGAVVEVHPGVDGDEGLVVPAAPGDRRQQLE